MIGKEVIITCKDRNSKMAWVEHLQRPLIYSPATSEERRLICEAIYRTSSMVFFIVTSKGMDYR